jgi:outer membrane protein
MQSTFKTLIAVAASLALTPAAFGQTKIGVVDYQRLLQESPQARAATAALEAEFGPKQKQLEAQNKDLEARVQKYERDKATMADTERVKTERDLRDSRLSLERHAKEFQEDAQMRQNEELQRAQKQIVEAVRTFAKAQGYELVIAQGVIYSAESIDITIQVLANLQSRAAANPAPASAPAAAAAKPSAPAASPKK